MLAQTEMCLSDDSAFFFLNGSCSSLLQVLYASASNSYPVYDIVSFWVFTDLQTTRAKMELSACIYCSGCCLKEAVRFCTKQTLSKGPTCLKNSANISPERLPRPPAQLCTAMVAVDVPVVLLQFALYVHTHYGAEIGYQTFSSGIDCP